MSYWGKHNHIFRTVAEMPTTAFMGDVKSIDLILGALCRPRQVLHKRVVGKVTNEKLLTKLARYELLNTQANFKKTQYTQSVFLTWSFFF